MIEHVVLFKWKDEAASEDIERAVTALRGLKEQIEGIVDLVIGPNFSERSQGYHHALVVRFRDQAALDVYVPNPIHQAVVHDLVVPIRADILVMDFEV